MPPALSGALPHRSERKRMASEQVLDVAVRRHIFNSERPFSAVLDGIFGDRGTGIRNPVSRCAPTALSAEGAPHAHD